MFVHITSGTYHYLQKTLNQYPDQDMHLFQNIHSQLWHQTNEPSVFQSPHSYELIGQLGTIENKGSVDIRYFTIKDQGKPIFAYEIKNILPKIEHVPGFIAIRILKPLKHDDFLVMTMWDNQNHKTEFEEMELFDEVIVTKSVYASPPYSKSYYVNEEEIEFDE